MKTPIKPLKDMLNSVREIEGFPVGKDADILALSDPPYYTACPNPYIDIFIKEFGTPYDEKSDDYHREPFVADVSAGKNDGIYKAHSYHTKVPYKAITPYIEHFTTKGDVVLDGFCGSGMTGFASDSLGRASILSDLSPFASLIAYNYTNKVNQEKCINEADRILNEIQEEWGWLYETNHNGNKGNVNYIVWSDILLCPYCGDKYVFYDVAVNKETKAVKKEYDCPSCLALLTKRKCERHLISDFDEYCNQQVSIVEQVPVLIEYTVNGKKFFKKPDADDFAKLLKIKEEKIPYWFPVYPMMGKGIQWGDSWRAGVHSGITHVHHFFTKRNLCILGAAYEKIEHSENIYKPFLRYVFEQSILGMSKLARYVPTHYSQVNQYLTGTLYVGSQVVEASINYILKGKIKRLSKIISSFGTGGSALR